MSNLSPEDLTHVFKETVAAGTLAMVAKHFSQLQTVQRSECKRIETGHVRHTASNARFFELTYVIEAPEEDVVENPAIVATHCAAQFGELVVEELKTQSIKQLHDLILLVDPLKPMVHTLTNPDPDHEGMVCIGLRLWLAAPKALPDGLKQPARPSEQELHHAHQSFLEKKLNAGVEECKRIEYQLKKLTGTGALKGPQ